MSTVKFLTLNVRGLRNQEKRRSIFSYLKRQKANIYLLQETFSNPKDERIWSAEWGGQIFYSHGSEHSKGVCVLIKPNSPIQVEIVELDTNGRFVILRLKTPGETNFNIVNIYAPTDYREQIDFIESLTKKIISLTDMSNLIIAGDWNTTFNSIDKQGGLPWKETKYRNSLIYFMEAANLVDIYRKIHPKIKTFTYESKTLKLKSRIDFFLISGKFQHDVTKVETRASIAPDHKAVFLSINLNEEFKRGPGLWKFNNTLLQDEWYLQLIKDYYPCILQKHADVTDKQLLWEMIKMEIRSETIRYSKRKSKQLKTRESAIQSRIEQLDLKICNDVCQDQQDLLEYEALKKELQGIYEANGKGAIFRSKVRWIEKGEKPTKYFFNLEKRNYDKKIISQLYNGEEELLSDFKKINKEIEDHFSQFYKTNFDPGEEKEMSRKFQSFVENWNLTHLEEHENLELEAEINIEEVQSAVNSFQNNKTPGDDGFTKEFYETFFDLIGPALLDSLNAGFECGTLSISQRRGVISLIPKDENNLMTLSNWRPITLLNVDYKILAKIIANRIKPVLPKLIHPDQTGFIKERFIGQNIRLLNDLMEYTDEQKIPGILLFIDFEKAFDTIEWTFIQNVLKCFNFGPVIRKWISVLYKDVESAVINGGYSSNYFKVSRGVRQGCPLSPLLFVLGVEILAQKIRQCTSCQGIKLPQSVEAKISQFADDTTLICRDVNALREYMDVLNKFNDISGLKLNKKKTKAMWIGSAKNNKTKPLGFQPYQEPIKSLGVNLSYNQDRNNNLNFFVKIHKMDTKLNMWQTRDLTLYGRTMLVKSLGISKIVYAASMLRVPETVVKTVQDRIFKFLWKNKKDKVKRVVMYQPFSHGGVNFPNIHTAVKSLRLSWLGRFLNCTNETWQAIPNSYFNKCGGLPFLLKCNYDSKHFDKKMPLFYSEMLDYFKEVRSGYPDVYNSEFILWNNKEITIESKSMFWKCLFDKGIYFVQDLLNRDGKFLSLENLQRKYDVQLNYLKYFQLIAAIPNYLKRKAQTTAITNRNIFEEWDTFYLSENQVISLTKFRCKDYYKLLQEKVRTEPTAVKTWCRRFPNFDSSWKEILHKIYKTTSDKKLREFGFKAFHRILVTNKELKLFKIRNDDTCSQCKNPDSLEHTFLECPMNVQFYQEILSWFNTLNNTRINLSVDQIFLQNYPPPAISDNLRRRLDLLILLLKRYTYSCKINEKNPNNLQLINKIKMQWKIENLA